MKTKDRLTQKSLAALARKLCHSVDDARWALAELAAQAKAEGVPGWAEIIGVECRREPRTVRAWAVTWEWTDQPGDKDWTEWLTYSFYEVGARYADLLGDTVILNLMSEFNANPGATLEAFRAELATLAGGDSAADFRHFAEKERKRIFDWIDRAPTRRAGDCLRLAADALADALTADVSTIAQQEPA